MILMIDNYDSFVYNLYQLIGSIQPTQRSTVQDHGGADQGEKAGGAHSLAGSRKTKRRRGLRGGDP